MNNSNNLKHAYSLKEIADWGSKTATEAEVSIPALQRGLVWKAGQVELLWDSILRGFPIGSMMLSSAEDTPDQKVKKSKYFLLDGQQRMNAIALGINEPADQKEVRLWFDLRTTSHPKNSSRKYWIRACTPAHPWGYTENDDCKPLPASDRREASKRYEVQNGRPIPAESWPHKAELPIPLYILFNAIACTSSEASFVEKILVELKECSDAWKRNFCADDGHEISDRIRKLELYALFQHVNDYLVTAVYLTKNDYQESAENAASSEENQTDIEVLFTRLNTQGTRISQSDLFYSAITAYWAEIKTANEKIAMGIMPPANLVMLTIRLALTENEKLHAAIDVARIRRIKHSKDPADEKAKKKILELYGTDREADESPLNRIMAQVENWLVYHPDTNPHGLPPVLRVEIGRQSPDVFLLLMWLSKEHPYLSNKFCIGIATLIHWFKNDERNTCNTIFQSVIKWNNPDHTQNAIIAGIAESIRKGYLIEPLIFDVLEEGFENNPEWNWEHFFAQNPCWRWLTRIKENRSILLYAQRAYLHQKFPTYNPSRLDLWEDHNRPWDIDHVIPQDWIRGKQGDYRKFCNQWLNSIGNLAAVSFEYNRSKGADDEWDEYVNNSTLLHYKENILDDVKKINKKVAYEKSMASSFAEVTKKRFRSIYEDWYGEHGLNISSFLNISILPVDHPIMIRMNLFNRIKECLRSADLSAQCYYFSGKRDFLISDNEHTKFCSTWISVGVLVNEKCLVCLTSNGNDYELGLRKGLMIDEVDKDYLKEARQKLTDMKNMNNQWWYECSTTTSPPDLNDVCQKIIDWYTRLKC